MRTQAAVLRELGKPLVIEELEIPQLRAGQVLVQIAYSGVCHSQLMEVKGLRGTDPYLPHLLGHEGTGVVVDVGTEVQKVRTGDRVVLTWVKGRGAECGGSRYHGPHGDVNAGAVITFTEYAVVSENRLVPLPEGLPMDVGALLGCAVLTGAGAVLNTVRPVPGSSLVVWGVGGVGLSALMAAKALGCSPLIAVDCSVARLALARELGATHAIDATTTDALAAVLAIAGDQGVGYALEAAGQVETIEQAFAAVRRDGGLCVFASHPPAGEFIRLDPHALISGKQIRGTWGGECAPDTDVSRFAAMYRAGMLPLERLAGRRYCLEEVNKALDDMEAAIGTRPLLVFGQ